MRQGTDPPDLDLPGDDLRQLVEAAEHDIVLAAPFIKASALAGVLEHASADVVVTCITRWRPEEVAAGVSDLAVFDVLAERPGAKLLLWPHLHAKYFRADRRCLVGSANVTARALGWVDPPNIELLIEAPATHPRLVAFEQRAVAEAQPATVDLRALVETAAEEIRLERDWPIVVSSDEDARGESDPVGEAPGHKRPAVGFWLPSLRQPSDLYRAYSGDLDGLSSASREAAVQDLATLDPPADLSAEAFAMVIAVALLQMPMIARIDAFTETSQRFGAVRELVANEMGLGFAEASTAWQTTMRWLMHFLPGRYLRTVPSHSEVFVRVAGNAATGAIPAS